MIILKLAAIVIIVNLLLLAVGALFGGIKWSDQ